MSTPDRMRTALVTGGNRGLGLATCRALRMRGLEVIVTARRLADARAATEEVGGRAEELDLASESSIAACAARLRSANVDIDVLVNNGGVFAHGDAFSTTSPDLRSAFDVNVLGAWFCARAFVPGMIERGYGRVVNVSSGWGSFEEGLDGPASYSVSKAALNAFTVTLARSVPSGVKVNACCPGWVQTRMGGSEAELTPEQGADTIVWLATLDETGPHGGFFRERKRISW